MKVLFVTLFALETNSSVTKSNIGILSGLRDLGAEIDIVMPEIDSSLSYYDKTFDLSTVNVFRIGKNNVMSNLVAANAKSTGIKKKMLALARQVYYKVRILDRGTSYIPEAKDIDIYDTYYDYVISTSDPKSSHVFAGAIIEKGLKYGKWVQHWGDPLASDITYHSIYPKFIVRNKEEKIIRDADRIVYVSPFTLEVQKKLYKKHADRMGFVPLPCDVVEDDARSAAHQDCSVLSISYLGDYTSTIRNIMPLYEACKKLDFIRLTIAGSTDIALEETENIKVYPRLPQAKVKEIEESTDVIVSIGNLHGNQIPGKIYYTASSSKMILVTIDGEYQADMKKYIDSFGRYMSCENTVDAITEQLTNIYQNLSELRNTKFKVPECILPIHVAKNVLGMDKA